MATIGSLAIKLTASAGQFVQGIGKADRSLANLTDTSRKFLTIVGLFKTAIAAVAVGALAAYVKHCIEGAAETVKLARSVGATTDGLVALQLEMANLGGDANGAASALQELNQRFGSVGADTDMAQQAFRALGLNFERLAGMSTDAAFGEIADAVSKVQDPTRRAALAFQIFGDQADKAILALSQGKQGMSDAAELAKQLGISIDAVSGANIVDADNKLRAVGEVVRAIGVQVAVEVVPWLIEGVKQLRDMGITGASMGGAVAAGIQTAVKGVAFMVDAWNVADATIRLAMGGWLIILGKVGEKTVQLARLVSLIPSPGKDDLNARLDSIEAEAKRLQDIGGIVGDEAKRAFDAAWGGEAQQRADAFFRAIIAGAGDAAAAMDRFNKQTGGGASVALSRFKKLFEDGKRVFEQSMTPAQRFGLEMEKLNRLLSLGIIGWDTYARAASGGLAQLDKAHQLSEVHLPAGVQAGTSAGVSAINQAEALNNIRFRETPEQRAARIVEESLEIEKQQLEMQRRIAQALATRPPIARF